MAIVEAKSNRNLGRHTCRLHNRTIPVCSCAASTRDFGGKKPKVAEFRSAGILVAACKVFANRGFHEATVDDIARAANIAKGTVYLYYQSKHDIYLAALNFGSLQWQSLVLTETQKFSTPDAKLKALIAATIGYFDKHRDFFKLYCYALANMPNTDPAGIHGDFKALYQEPARMVERLLKEGARQKLFRPLRSHQAALAILDIMRSVVAQRVLGWSQSELDEDVDSVFHIAWKGIRV